MTAELADLARAAGRLAIDTEFVSERRYRAQLCLVQVAVADAAAEDGVRTEVLDPIADDRLDPAPLAAVLADPDVEVFVHAGRQDVAIVRRTWATAFTRVFDTQVAGGFLGLGSQEGYESLVRRVLKVRLEGREGFTKWDRRPLEPAQLEYARDDARLLLALGDELQRRLREAGRLEWAVEECRVVEESNDARDPDEVYAKLPKLGRLKDEQRAVAHALVAWRERTAQGMDRPVGYLVPDHALAELARRMPTDPSALEHVRGLPPQTAHRRGDELIEVIRVGRGGDALPPPPDVPRRDPREAPLVSLAQALVRQRAQENGVATELIATQADLTAVVAATQRGQQAVARVLEGWRRELVGDELLEVLSGRLWLRVGAEGELVASPHPAAP